jgi:hypothetical protein
MLVESSFKLVYFYFLARIFAELVVLLILLKKDSKNKFLGRKVLNSKLDFSYICCGAAHLNTLVEKILF